MSISARQIERQNFIIVKQLQKMNSNPHFTIVSKDPDNYEVFYILLHPQGGHFANQQHILELKTIYGTDSIKYYFPFNPPLVKFLTKIYHTNISHSGSICLDILQTPNKWSPQYTIETVMTSIIALLDDPNTSHPFNPEPSQHWTKCFRKYREYLESHKKDSVGNLMKVESEIFEEYDKKAFKVSLENKLDEWAQYFPTLLNLDKMKLA